MHTHIVLVGGGTGGHIFPLLAIFQYCRNEGLQHDFSWIGEEKSLEQKIATESGIPFFAVQSAKIRRYFSYKTIFAPLFLCVGILQSLVLLGKLRPKAVFSKGWYVSVPVACAAWMLRIPVYLHESDAIAGWANRVVGMFCRKVFLNFSEASAFFAPEKITLAGPLLSPALFMTTPNLFPPKKKPLLFVLCGSQGSTRIFEALLEYWEALVHFETHIVLGTMNAAKFRPLFANIEGIFTYDFLTPAEIGSLAARADYAVTRASSALFELQAFDVHMLMIPLAEAANNHQLANAQAFQYMGHDLLEEKDLDRLWKILFSYTQIRKETPFFPKHPDGCLAAIKHVLWS